VKISAAAAKYCATRHTISTLAPSLNQGGWEVEFPVLNDSDIKRLTNSSTPTHSHPSEGQEVPKAKKKKRLCQSEGHCEITWIWKKLGTLENSNKLLQDGIALDPHPAYLYTNDTCVDLQIEFCKSKAHADHWAEEVELLQEEMKWVKWFFETQACCWAAHVDAVGKTNCKGNSQIPIF